jgi:hypothetical protein
MAITEGWSQSQTRIARDRINNQPGKQNVPPFRGGT